MTKPNALFWIVAIVALIWNLMGITAFLVDTFAAEAMMEGYTEAQKEVHLAAPIWSKVAYGAATITGILGAIALVARKKWAVSLFFLSLLASIVHSGYIIFGMDGMNNFGIGNGLIFPLLIIILDLFFWWYSKFAQTRGWLR